MKRIEKGKIRNTTLFFFFNTIFSIFGYLGIFVGLGQCFFSLVLYITKHWPRPTKIPDLPKILNMALKRKKKN
jgi:hypothetical protein